MIDRTTLKDGSRLLINKPYEWSSFDVVKKVRVALEKADIKTKIGHGGTLDPLATGLLILHTGKLTRSLAELQNMDKVYDGEICIGSSSESYDREKPILKVAETGHILPDDVFGVFRSFIGPYDQLPPAHSAVKVQGKRAYKLARKGQQVELEARKLYIHRFDVTRLNLPIIEFDVHCTKGTYIRALARDVGDRLGVGAYLHSLRRTEIGPYHLADALELEELLRMIENLKN